MSGFDKIEFAQQSRTPTASTHASTVKKAPQDFAKSQSITEDSMAKRRKSSPKKFRFSKKLSIGLGIFALLVVLIAIPAYATYQSGLKTYRQSQLVSSALKKQNIELASQEITKTQEYLEETKKNLHYMVPLKFVPVVGWYYSDADHMMNAATYGLESAKTVTDSLAPYADVLGLKGDDSFAGGSTEDRIKTAVLSMGKITPEIDKIESSIVKVQKEIDQVNPDHYPKLIFGSQVKDQLTTLRLTADQTATAVSDAKPLIKTLPSLLGEKEAKRYLVLFQNDKELRATGGFITAYAIFSIDKGIIKFEKSDDIYKLDDSIRNKPKAPAPILKYLPKVYTLNLRDSNLSPDFIESMKTFEEMYERAALKEEVDGIIAIDTHVLVSTVKILDDQVQAGGQTFTTVNDPRCDCPQIIYELENDISRPVNYIKTDRKSVIGDLISAIMVKALSSSPQQYWGPLFQSIIAQTQQKHIMFKLYDEQAQQGIVALNAAGQIRPFEGDYLHINEVNFSGAKVNIFMEERVDNEYKVDADGTITKTLTIKYKNPFPPSDCNLERGGLCLNAEYRDWIRIYVPQGSELVDSKGSQVKMTTYDELGKTVIDGFVTVRPKGVGTLTVTYKLPFKLEKNSPLPLLIQKQPGTAGHEYQTIINGKTVEMFNLTTDKETKLEL
ncbi:MAG: DUF4012 domain-containing protein [Candidatus Levybacteria bacterium]|nr:DUF4012 domain-containing protein [Candidatus Levybacteria bacterium]